MADRPAGGSESRAGLRIALCNEVLRGEPFGRRCEPAAASGYDGLETAPFTLGGDPHLLPAAAVDRTALRRAAAEAGLDPCGPHRRLAAPPGLSTTIAEAGGIVRAIGNPSLRATIDACAAGTAEAEPPAALIDRWMPTGLLAHVYLNEPNKRDPGQGAMRFGPMSAALHRHGYAGWIGVEPFDCVSDGPTSAARAVGLPRGLLEDSA